MDPFHEQSLRTTRRHFLGRAAKGIGSAALASLLSPNLFADSGADDAWRGVVQPLHFAPKAKRVIHLVMSGGPSHLETFDYKPKLGELAGQWAHEHANFTFVPVLSEPRPEDQWTGRTGLVHEAILADFPDLSRHQVYACGSVQMVEAAYPAFVKRGISSDDCFSDAFHLAPQRPLSAGNAEMVKLGGSNV